jgi:predicted metal-binding membrane protein
MKMPGGWTMSMLWMRMPGQSWPGAAASFLGMWVAMMISMMLPSLAPVLWRYRQALAMTDESPFGRLTALMSLGYFFVWAAVGMAVFAAGAALAALEMKLPVLARALPLAVTGVAWRHGLRLGVRCSACCAGLTAALLVVGVMNLPAMAVVTAAISLERLAPAGERVARAIGVVILGAGMFLIARACRLG